MELKLNIKRSDRVILWDTVGPILSKQAGFFKDLFKAKFDLLSDKEIAEVKMAILKCAKELEA